MDFALRIKDKPVVFIEVKPARNNLVDDDKTQLLGYCEAAGVQLGVLTNGFGWYLYSGAASAEIDDAVEIDLAEGDTENKIWQIARDFGDFLSKDRVDNSANAHEAIKARRVEVELARQWNKMLQDGDQKLVSALRRKMKQENFSLSFPRVKGFIQQRSSAPATSVSARKERAPARTRSKKAQESAMPQKKTKGKNLQKVSGRTVKRPGSIKLFGQPVKFGSWASMMRTFFDEVYRRDPNCLVILTKRIPDRIVEGEANVKASWRPHEIAGTDIWVNTNMNSGDIVGLCKEVRKVLGLPMDCFELVYD